jgi:hypothetical protein
VQVVGLSRLHQPLQAVDAGLDRARKTNLFGLVQDHHGWKIFNVDVGQKRIVVFDVQTQPAVLGVVCGQALKRRLKVTANDTPLGAKAKDVQVWGSRRWGHETAILGG